MTRNLARRPDALLTLGLLLLFATSASAGEFTSKLGQGGEAFFASPPCPVKQFPTFESLVPVPNIVDPFEQNFVPMFCEIIVEAEGKGVKKAKGKFETELFVVDNISGMTESFPIKSGSFKTNKQGTASFDFELPTELFADGFESGDVSAWSYTRSDFTNKKKGARGQISCGASASRSD